MIQVFLTRAAILLSFSVILTVSLLINQSVLEMDTYANTHMILLGIITVSLIYGMLCIQGLGKILYTDIKDYNQIKLEQYLEFTKFLDGNDPITYEELEDLKEVEFEYMIDQSKRINPNIDIDNHSVQ